MKLVKDTGVNIISQIFDNDCSMTIETNADDVPPFRNRLVDIDGVNIEE
jgi:hypothetical protein